MGKGIIFSKGKKWKENRVAMSAIFHFDSLNQRIPTIEKITKEVFRKYINEKQLNKVDIIEMFQEITASVVVQSFFSNNFENKTFYGMTLT